MQVFPPSILSKLIVVHHLSFPLDSLGPFVVPVELWLSLL